MVAAMAAEFSQQAHIDAGNSATSLDVTAGTKGMTVSAIYPGSIRFDLQKVARAGLAAIRDLPDSLYDDGAVLDPEVIGYDRSPETYWQTVIFAILTVKP
jgi:hypothetical protein